jgi:hypothetical protein
VRIKPEIDGRSIRPYMGVRDSVCIVDFLVTLKDGKRELHEVKGYVNPKDPVSRLWMLKLGVVQAMWPDVEIVLATRARVRVDTIRHQGG